MLQYIACCKMSIDDKHIVGWQNKELLLKIKNSLSGLPVWACDCCQLAIRHYTRSESCMWYLIFVISYMCKNTCGHEFARNDCREVNGFSCGKNHLTFHMDILSLKLMKVHMSTTDLSAGKNLCFIWVMKFYGKFLYEALDYSISSFILVSYFDESGSFVLPGFMFLWLSQPF